VSNPSDGKLSGRDGDVISVQYADLVPEIAISRTVVAVSTHTATVQIQPTIPVAGGVIRVTVADADLDVDASTADSTVVTLTASAGDSETLHLLETGNSTGVFTGSMLTAAGVLDTPGVLDGAAEGLTLTASFTDDLPDAGQIRVHTSYPQPFALNHDPQPSTDFPDAVRSLALRLLAAPPGVGSSHLVL
jgi:hypothetical protein